MSKIILDTNVLVSSLIQKSYPYLILDDVFYNDSINICASPALMLEYYEVLKRPKFSRYPDFIRRAELLLADIERKAIVFYPTIKLHIIRDDPDNRLSELAEESNADFLITGNTNDFIINTYKNTSIISPKEFFENHFK